MQTSKKESENNYDVIVVGGGHAGLEACFATSNMGLKTCLITLKKESVGSCPCNPSIGGPAKGIVTREIDALGGMQAKATDINQLQMKMLNESKGAGVKALRAQIDKIKYHQWFLEQVKKQKKLTLLIDEVEEIIVKNDTIIGVKCKKKRVINAKAVIITAGTYMKAKTFSGFNFENAGPVFDYQNNKHQIKTEVSPRSNYLSDSLKKNGIETIRLKTGTPPRIYKKTIDFKNLEIQKGSCEKLAFEHFNQTYLSPKNQLNCHMVYTNTKTHRIILDNLKKSPMYRGKIKSIGPRYCPSIEDKVVRFSDKPRHQLFIEPESTLMDTVYLQGFSTALPKKIQDKMIRTLQGFKKCKVQRYAYAIEYDAINPMQLFPTLETKKIRRLFFAGQINGTSGYEEAAGQGIVAGINTALKIKNAKPLILKRSESYIGVMIDDIVTKGVSDPYRLLTSRAEYRLFLRNDNADDRLIKYGFKYGLIPKGNYQFYLKQNKNINELIRLLKNTSLGSKLVNKYGNSNHNLYDLLKRPEIKLTDILQNNITNKLTIESIYKLEILVKFEGYLISQQKNIDKFNKMENICLAKIKDYRLIKNLSLEARDKLNKIKPLNLNQAQRISGLTSNDIINIKYYLDKNK